jgi:hypothetical protein
MVGFGSDAMATLLGSCFVWNSIEVEGEVRYTGCEDKYVEEEDVIY